MLEERQRPLIATNYLNVPSRELIDEHIETERLEIIPLAAVVMDGAIIDE